MSQDPKPKYSPGDHVILGCRPQGLSSHAAEYLAHEGREAIIAEVHTYDDGDWKYSIEKVGDLLNHWIWRESLMKPVSVQSTQSAQSGIACSGCQEWNDYATANQPDGTFKCYTCRH